MMQGLCAARLTLPTLFLVLVGARSAGAQAWVGEQKSLDLSFDYNFASSDVVVGDDGLEFPDSGSQTHQFTIGAEYVPIENLGINLSIPFVALKYTGNLTAYPHPGGGRYDDGSFHGTLTDGRLGAHYQVLAEPVAIAPHLAFSVPLQSYETIGNTVAGRHLKAAHLGLSIGKVLMEALYLHLQYEFSLVEKYDRTPETAEYSQNRSDASVVAGYLLMDGRLDLNLSSNMRFTHGGVSLSDFGTLLPAEERYHDAILKESMILVGAGVGYALSDTMSAALAARLFVSGANTQKANVFGLSFTWSPQL